MKILLTILCLVLLVSYSQESFSKQVPVERIVERNGLVYEVNSERPFNGSSVEYYKNSKQIKVIENYKYGQRNGKSSSFHRNGQISSEVNFLEGRPSGQMTFFESNGQIHQKYPLKNSTWRFYFNDLLLVKFKSDGTFSFLVNGEKPSFNQESTYWEIDQNNLNLYFRENSQPFSGTFFNYWYLEGVHINERGYKLSWYGERQE